MKNQKKLYEGIFLEGSKAYLDDGTLTFYVKVTASANLPVSVLNFLHRHLFDSLYETAKFSFMSVTGIKASQSVFPVNFSIPDQEDPQ